MRGLPFLVDFCWEGEREEGGWVWVGEEEVDAGLSDGEGLGRRSVKAASGCKVKTKGEEGSVS